MQTVLNGNRECHYQCQVCQLLNDFMDFMLATKLLLINTDKIFPVTPLLGKLIVAKV